MHAIRTEDAASAAETFRAFAAEHVAPHADAYDREERIPREAVDRMADRGLLGLILPPEFGGSGADMLTYGLLHEEIGHASASAQGVINVHNMATRPLVRWGTAEQKQRWLPAFASGEALAAFAITEPEVGSDAAHVRTAAREDGERFVLNGTKKWITCGQVADVFLILASCEGQPAAFLVERDRPGLRTRPIRGLLGCRGYMLAEIVLEECAVPREHLVGRIGLGLSQVASVGLDIGRYGLAWGCVGMLRACLEASVRYARQRVQFGAPIGDNQLVQRMITRMVASTEAARLICRRAGALRDARDRCAVSATALAKYYASTQLVSVATDAVQIHGAAGCSADYPVQRYQRDAKIMELIEGSTQMQEISIANYAYREYGAPRQASRDGR